MKIVKRLLGSSLLLKDVTKTTENEMKAQKDGFLGLLVGTLGERL